MAHPKFTEVQKFRQIWIWLALIWVAGICLFLGLKGFYIQIIRGIPWGEMPMSDAGMIFFTLFMLVIGLGIPWLILSARLTTEIDREGIRLRFRPFLFSAKHYPWRDIQKAYVRRYKPILEYGGWGVRYGFGGRAYNISGNRGLQLEFRDGKKLLIGTSRPDELQAFLDREIFSSRSED